MEASYGAALEPQHNLKGLEIILSGYSYGSMIASYIPPIQNLSSLFPAELDDARMKYMLKLANMLASDMSPIDPRNPDNVRKYEDAHNYNFPVKSFYLLVSPLVPPITWALALSLGNPFSGTSTSVKSHLWQQCTFAIFGSRDVFASREKLVRWAEDLSSRPESRFTFEEIQGAGHFWHEAGVLSRLKATVKAWIETHATSLASSAKSLA